MGFMVVKTTDPEPELLGINPETQIFFCEMLILYKYFHVIDPSQHLWLFLGLIIDSNEAQQTEIIDN